jgi:hypothetical protein
LGSLPIGLSGSRSAGILGLSPYTTPLEVWQNIMEIRKPGFNAERGFLYEKFEGDASTRFGNAFESSVIELTEHKTGNQIIDREGAYSLKGKTPITCHIDGRFSKKHIFEGKTAYIRAFNKSFGEPGTDRIPVEYQCQVQSNMMVTGAEQCTLSALVFPRSPEDWEDEGWSVNNIDGCGYRLSRGLPALSDPSCSSWAKSLEQMGYFHTYPVSANRDIHKLLRECYNDFWQRYVIPELPPDITDYEDIRRLFPAPKGQLIVPENIQSMLREYSDITKELGTGGFLANRKKDLKTEILDFCRTKTTVEDDDSQEKITFLDHSGNSIGSFNGKSFRAS